MQDAGSIPRKFELGINYRCRMSRLIHGECILNRAHGTVTLQFYLSELITLS